MCTDQTFHQQVPCQSRVFFHKKLHRIRQRNSQLIKLTIETIAQEKLRMPRKGELYFCVNII
ncbi:hypothetical protein Hanom_Chr12g01132421 [Helianthus anomalus]